MLLDISSYRAYSNDDYVGHTRAFISNVLARRRIELDDQLGFLDLDNYGLALRLVDDGRNGLGRLAVKPLNDDGVSFLKHIYPSISHLNPINSISKTGYLLFSEYGGSDTYADGIRALERIFPNSRYETRSLEEFIVVDVPADLFNRTLARDHGFKILALPGNKVDSTKPSMAFSKGDIFIYPLNSRTWEASKMDSQGKAINGRIFQSLSLAIQNVDELLSMNDNKNTNVESTVENRFGQIPSHTVDLTMAPY